MGKNKVSDENRNAATHYCLGRGAPDIQRTTFDIIAKKGSNTHNQETKDECFGEGVGNMKWIEERTDPHDVDFSGGEV